MTHFIEDYGLVFLFAIVTLESAGLWLPGETALIAAVWAVAVGLLAFFAGKAAADALARYGVYAAIALALLVVLLIAGLHLWRRRVAEGRA